MISNVPSNPNYDSIIPYIPTSHTGDVTSLPPHRQGTNTFPEALTHPCLPQVGFQTLLPSQAVRGRSAGHPGEELSVPYSKVQLVKAPLSALFDEGDPCSVQAA